MAAERAQLPNCVDGLGRELQRRLALAAAGVCAADVAQRERALPSHGHRLWLCAGVNPHDSLLHSCKGLQCAEGPQLG